MKKFFALLLSLLLIVPSISVPASAASSGGFKTYYWSGSIKQHKIGLEYDLIATGVRMDDTDIPEGTAPVFQKEHGTFPYEFSMTMRNSSNSLYYPDSQSAEAADCPVFSILLDGTQIIDGSKTADLLSELYNMHSVGTTTGTNITAYFLDGGNRYIYEIGGTISYDNQFGWGIKNAELLELNTKKLALGKHTLSFTVNPKYRSEEIDPNNNTVSRDFYIKESAPTAPEVPVLESAAAASITVKAVLGLEYSIDGGLTWQDSGVFSDLTPETAYEIVSRVKETETALAGQVSPALSAVTTSAKQTPAAPDAPTVQRRTDVSIALDAAEGLEYSIDHGTTWQLSPIFAGLTAGTEYAITARYAETDLSYASPESAPITVRTKLPAPAAPAVPRLLGRTDTTISVC